MSKPSFIVVGAGPGGEAAAKRAAAKGAQVTLIEKKDVGGLCLNRGCIPSKTLLETGRLLKSLRAGSDCLEGQLHVQWPSLQKKKNQIVSSIRTSLTQNLTRLGVRILEGEARFIDEKSLSVKTKEGTQTLGFDVVIIATGSSPFFPEPFPAIRNSLLDSDRVLDLPAVPKNLIVVGGGAVGCEFACLFHELGTRVTLIEKTEGLLPGEDAAIVRALQGSFEKRGIRVMTNTTVQTAERSADWKCRLSSGELIEADEILVCVGRRPFTDGLDIEAVKLKTDKGRIVVDEFLQTSHPGIYAIGDVNGLSLLAHAASAQGEAAVDHALGEKNPYANHLVPRCLYTWPEVASVGEWAYSAQAKNWEVASKRFFFQGSAKALADNEGEGFIQTVIEKKSGRLLGAQIVGPHATELIHIFSVAIKAGMTADQLRSVIFAHPTLSEGVREALSR